MSTTVAHFISRTNHRIYYRTTGGLYWKVFTNFPPAFKLNNKAGHSSRETYFSAVNKKVSHSLIASLSSSTFWWWYTVTSNVRDLNPYDVQNFPVPKEVLQDKQLRKIGDSYLRDIDRNSTMLTRQQKQTGKTETQSFKIKKSKPIIDASATSNATVAARCASDGSLPCFCTASNSSNESRGTHPSTRSLLPGSHRWQQRPRRWMRAP